MQSMGAVDYGKSGSSNSSGGPPGGPPPVDDWLPTMTSSRNAKWYYSAFHNVTAMVGAGVLGLPYALSELGWYVVYLSQFNFKYFVSIRYNNITLL